MVTGKELISRAIAGDVEAGREFARLVWLGDWGDEPCRAIARCADYWGAALCAEQYDAARRDEDLREIEAAPAYADAAREMTENARRNAGLDRALGEHLTW